MVLAIRHLKISASLYAAQHTMSAVIANEFTEADTDLYLSALIEIGLVLFVLTVIINAISRFLIWSVSREVKVKPAKAAAPAVATPPAPEAPGAAA